jgi:hypothetical protein
MQIRVHQRRDFRPLKDKSYFRNGTKVVPFSVYSVQNCIEEFQAEFRNFAVDHIELRKLWTEL